MDARTVQRLLDKTLGMADTVLAASAKTADAALRDARLSDAVKGKLIPLYGEEALRRTLNYAGLGLAICLAIQDELDDAAAREQLDFYSSRFQVIYDNARAVFDRDFRGSEALIPP
jgi:hypothetical protein